MYKFTDRYMADEKGLKHVKATMMGPNALRLSEEMASYLKIDKGMRILDLGCGKGLSTFLLAKKYGASVFAADLWISPTENFERFKALGIDDKAVPLSVDATKGLPFAHGYFDMLFSVDAYHYFGDTEEMLPSLVPYVKKGGYIAVSVPGIKYEFGDNVPEEMQPFWIPEVARTIHSTGWWTELWQKAAGIEIVSIGEMACCDQSWAEWHTSDYPDLDWDKNMKKAEAGNYYNLIQLIAKAV